MTETESDEKKKGACYHIRIYSFNADTILEI